MAQDHSFRVVNSRTGKLILETESWYEAADRQYSENRAEQAEGFQPDVRLWLVDADDRQCIVETQIHRMH